MRTIKYKLSVTWIMALFLLLSTTQCSESAGLSEELISGDEKHQLATAAGELTDSEIEGIRFMREEEKLARDVYQYLYELYPLRPFGNIASSEQAHMDAIEYLISTYQIEDPVGENPRGVFQNEDLQ